MGWVKFSESKGCMAGLFVSMSRASVREQQTKRHCCGWDHESRGTLARVRDYRSRYVSMLVRLEIQPAGRRIGLPPFTFLHPSSAGRLLTLSQFFVVFALLLSLLLCLVLSQFSLSLPF